MTRSIVVVCHSGQPWLERCLTSAGEEADEVVLVDNGSPGGLASAVGRRLGAVVVGLRFSQSARRHRIGTAHAYHVMVIYRRRDR